MRFLTEVAQWLTSSANWSGPDGIVVRAVSQVELSAAVIGTSILIGVGIGFALGHTRRGGFFAVNAANAARAVPSLALLTLLVTWPIISLKGDGFYASFLALVALAIPPILTNAYVSMRGVDAEVIEAAKAVGMSSWQRFIRVEVPLAAPLAVAGIRTAAVEVVATSTLAAYVTFNDLGDFIFAGLATNDTVESFSGALLVAVLAGLTDLAFLCLYRLVLPVSSRRTASGSRVAAAPDAAIV
ncbi:MAG TPA: ABC transporter permease [Acidimicrobiales bacterium]